MIRHLQQQVQNLPNFVMRTQTNKITINSQRQQNIVIHQQKQRMDSPIRAVKKEGSKKYFGISRKNTHETDSTITNMSAFSECKNCMILSKKMQDLQKIKELVNSLVLQKKNYQEEIQLMVCNFSYILQLACKNILKGVQNRVKLILEEKTNIIQNLNKKIKRSQQQFEQLMGKLEMSQQAVENNVQLKQNLEKVTLQNQYLRKLVSQNCTKQKQSFPQSTRIKLSTKSLKQFNEIQKSISHTTQQIAKIRDEMQNRMDVKKKKDKEQVESPKELVKVKSLDNLKKRIININSECRIKQNIEHIFNHSIILPFIFTAIPNIHIHIPYKYQYKYKYKYKYQYKYQYKYKSSSININININNPTFPPYQQYLPLIYQISRFIALLEYFAIVFHNYFYFLFFIFYFYCVG